MIEVWHLAVRPASASAPARVAMLSVHTSPLDNPGGGDAGGLNVYVVETARRLADKGTAVEIFTRATSSGLPPTELLHPGVLVRHVTAGPFEGLGKTDLPAQLCAFTAAVLRTEAYHEPGWYDLIHSHYWLSGQVGWLASERWGVPLVHTAHTLEQGQERRVGRGRRPRAAVAHHRRRAGGRCGRSADRLDHRRGGAARRALRRRSGSGRHRAARRRSRRFHPGPRCAPSAGRSGSARPT